jgi:pimeloyl-ACP methyl ester carboxylesterase
VPQKYVLIDGVATYLHHTGATTLPDTPPDTSQGEVVLCLHGTGGHGGDFSGILGVLGERHSPLAFDQPGHGRSGSLDSLGAVDRMRDFTRTLTEKLGLRPHVLVGHSLGAAVALDYALEFKDAVRGLVICSGGAGISFPDGYLENAKLVTEGKRRRDFDPKAFAEGADPKLMRKGFMAGMKTDPRATYGDLLACQDWQRQEDLARIEVPTLVIHGDAESSEVISQANKLLDCLPNSSKVVVGQAGRMILYEQPEALASEIGTFLGGLS